MMASRLDSSTPLNDDSEAEHLPAVPAVVDPRLVWGSGWETTLNKCIPAIVSIHVTVCFNFDTQKATNTEATGFIVDAQRGIILTNRHVVTPAPIIAYAKTHMREEIDLWPIYRDPVHDFGFFRYDPSKVRMGQLAEIPLAPENARVGVEIRVVGNDAGEHLSILPGTLARLDRQAPNYGVGKYNDFNTFYYQAASATSGGSSGSPVIDIGGNAVALNAGGHRDASTSFYIPLFRVQRALKYVSEGQLVPRGTIQAIFLHTTFDEVRRLGLSESVEQEVREANGADLKGMLVVNKVTPQGPSYKFLEPGDVLYKINGSTVVDFDRLNTFVDDSVGNSLTITIERGGKVLEFSVEVQDLHAITPSKFVIVSGCIIHELSYMMAVNYQVPVLGGGVYVALPGYMLSMAGISRNCIIKSVNNKPTPNLDEFAKVIATLEDSAKVPVRYYYLVDVSLENVATVTVDRHWHPCKQALRNDATGLWDFENLPDAVGTFSPKPATTSLLHVSNMTPAVEAVLPTLCSVEFNIPFQIDGVHTTRFVGTGIILDVNLGLVLVDSNTITISIGDITVTFQGSITIPAKQVYKHPIHNFSIVSYDPALLGTTPVKPAKLSSTSLVQGDSVIMVAISGEGVVSRATTVTSVRETFVNEASPPRFRAMNVDIVEVDNPVACDGGVLADKDGNVQALWSSFSYQDRSSRNTEFFAGIDIKTILPVLEPLQAGKVPNLRSMLFESAPKNISDARDLGLNDEWVQKLQAANPSKRNVFRVRRTIPGTPSSAVMKVGDMVLSANDKLITSFRDFDAEITSEVVRLTLLRDSVEMTVDVPTVPLDGFGTNRVIGWAGAGVQMPHLAALERSKKIPEGVYVSFWKSGSPAQQSGLFATLSITEVDGKSVPNLDAFLSVVSQIDDSRYVRVKTVDFSDRVSVLTLRPNKRYFPLWELVRDESVPTGWRYIEHQK